MPHFYAPFTASCNVVGDIFLLDILPPESRGAVDYTLGANVVLDLPETLIAPELAQEFGADSVGEEISVVLHQRSFKTLNIHEFDPIPVRIRFAPPRLGPNYIQIGLDDLQKYFEISHFETHISESFTTLSIL